MKPLIAVLPLYNAENKTIWINPLYMGGVEQAGGIPVLLPLSDSPDLWEGYLDAFDGFVFTGGQDIDPCLYGEEKIPECGYQAAPRDRQEIYMLRRLMEMDKPTLGICRGIQAMNAAAGGSLWQDIFTQRPTPVVHRQEMPYDLPHHQIQVEQGTMLHDILGLDRLSVNSMHHQAVKNIAPGFRAAAIAEDGMIEAIEHPDKKFMLGVQWHPEHMWQRYDSAKKIWRALVAACGK